MRIRRSQVRGAGLLAILLLLAIAAWSPSLVSGISIQRPNFSGHFGGAPDSEVRIRLRERRDKASTLRIEVRRLPLYCEDGTTRAVKLGPMRTKVGPGARFGFLYLSSYDSLFSDIYSNIWGKLETERLITGRMTYIDDYPAASPLPDCSTRGAAYWRARELNRPR